MKVLLTGAFGNVGRSTLTELVSKGYEVRAFDLDTPENREYAKMYENDPDVVMFWGNLCSPEDALRACEGIDVVIHVAAIIPPLADKKPELAKAVNVGGTQNILAAIKAQPQPPRLIFTSSISVYGDRVQNPFIRVTDPLNPNDDDDYARTKVTAENLIQDSGITSAIFRLTYIVSPDKLQMDPLMFHMPLKTSIEICHTRDVGLALTNAVENEQIWGGTYHIAGGEKCRTTYNEYIKHMMELFGLGSNLLPENAFSTGKFHCGFMDTERSQTLLKYQQTTLEDYYAEVAQKVGYKKWGNWAIRWFIRRYLLSKSQFYKNSRNPP